MKRKLITTIAIICAIIGTEAKITHLLPTPQIIKQETGYFPLHKKIRINDATNNPLLKSFIETYTRTTKSPNAPAISVEIVEEIKSSYDYPLQGYPNEAYSLKITPHDIIIKAITPTGVTRATQTLAQMAEGYDKRPMLECAEIVDWPAFKLRGFMHDVGRSYIPMEEIKHQIKLLSHFKINTFHFHLTENQAWRFEVKKYPQLTADSSMTRFPGKYYTQEECSELEEYAKTHGVTIIPEIDMPGHSRAFKRAMGHSMQCEQGIEELKNILEEVAATFPSAPYIHIGADEESITYPDFLKIMSEKVHSLGKKVIMWNPIRGVRISTSTGADMTQMWSTAGRKIEGLPNIDCRYNYVNHFDTYADVVGIYKSNIYYSQKGSNEVAGTITAIWNDRKLPDHKEIIRQNNLYANTLASGERAWKGGGKQYIEQGGTTLRCHDEEYKEFADWERRFLFHKSHTLRNEQIPYVKQCNVHWCITEAFPNNGDASKIFPPETEGTKNAYTYEGKRYNVSHATGAGIYLRHTWGGIIPTHFAHPQTGPTAYAWTYIYSPIEQKAGAQIEIQNYGRSEKDLAPENGSWDRRGSGIWLNDQEILPPTWHNSSKPINNETELMNENFTARNPIQVTIKKGWNKVFMKLPNNPDGGVRLNKWMFTFVLTDTNGNNALENIIYCPTIHNK